MVAYVDSASAFEMLRTRYTSETWVLLHAHRLDHGLVGERSYLIPRPDDGAIKALKSNMTNESFQIPKI